VACVTERGGYFSQVGAAVGMEFYARIAHKSWWHETWMWALPVEWRRYVSVTCQSSLNSSSAPSPCALSTVRSWLTET
jgi:hypothetical protein